jgi:hypothetical protein
VGIVACVRALLAGADTFFIATWHPEGGADASHRGGRPLGNLVGHPWAGLLFADFATGDVLQLTGRVRLVREREIAVRVEVDEVRETPRGIPLRFELVEASAANP